MLCYIKYNATCFSPDVSPSVVPLLSKNQLSRLMDAVFEVTTQRYKPFSLYSHSRLLHDYLFVNSFSCWTHQLKLATKLSVSVLVQMQLLIAYKLFLRVSILSMQGGAIFYLNSIGSIGNSSFQSNSADVPSRIPSFTVVIEM